eukprot:scaffold25050_cov38-Prasinocladus_malaysianus.AAC.1
MTIVGTNSNHDSSLVEGAAAAYEARLSLLSPTFVQSPNRSHWTELLTATKGLQPPALAVICPRESD